MLKMAQFSYPCLSRSMTNVDVSSFLLFEDSGDSEANADEVGSDVAMDEDDAESCSWDSADANSSDEVIAFVEDEDYDDHGVVQGYRSYDDDYEEEEEDDEVSSSDYKRWRQQQQQQMKSCVSVDSSKEFEMLNEVEKSKLFWETCLAS